MTAKHDQTSIHIPDPRFKEIHDLLYQATISGIHYDVIFEKNTQRWKVKKYTTDLLGNAQDVKYTYVDSVGNDPDWSFAASI